MNPNTIIAICLFIAINNLNKEPINKSFNVNEHLKTFVNSLNGNTETHQSFIDNQKHQQTIAKEKEKKRFSELPYFKENQFLTDNYFYSQNKTSLAENTSFSMHPLSPTIQPYDKSLSLEHGD